MPTTTSAHASLIERLQQHLRVEGYSPSIRRSYPTLAGHFLDYCKREDISMEIVRSSHVTQFLQGRYQFFCRRHGGALPFRVWRRRYTGAVHMLLRLVHGRWPVAEPPATALEAFHQEIVRDYDMWLGNLRGLHPLTRSRRTKYALRLLASLGRQADQKHLAGLSICDVDAYFRQCCTGLQRGSIKECTLNLRDFLRHLYRSRRTTADLASQVIGPRIYRHEDIPSALRAEDVRRVLEVTRQDPSSAGLRDYAILLLLATYGLRAGEIVRLRLEDIDWRRDALRVHHSKTGTHSELPLLREPGEAVLRYLKKGRSPSAHREVFLSIRAPYRPFKCGSTLNSVTNTRLQAAGIIPQGRRGPHAFRHARAMSLLRSGSPLKVIGDVLGHRSASATAVYLKLATKDLRAIGLEFPGGESI